MMNFQWWNTFFSWIKSFKKEYLSYSQWGFQIGHLEWRINIWNRVDSICKSWVVHTLAKSILYCCPSSLHPFLSSPHHSNGQHLKILWCLYFRKVNTLLVAFIPSSFPLIPNFLMRTGLSSKVKASLFLEDSIILMRPCNAFLKQNITCRHNGNAIIPQQILLTST